MSLKPIWNHWDLSIKMDHVYLVIEDYKEGVNLSAFKTSKSQKKYFRASWKDCEKDNDRLYENNEELFEDQGIVITQHIIELKD